LVQAWEERVLVYLKNNDEKSFDEEQQALFIDLVSSLTAN